MIPTFNIPEALHYIVANHKHFVEKVCDTGIVYTLKNEEGYVSAPCHLMEDDESLPFDKLCFWSDRDLAASCITEEWQDCTIDAIPLSDFIEKWCVGMSSEDLIAGTEASVEGIGFEIDPLELVLQLAEQLKLTGKQIELQQYGTLNDLVRQIRGIIS